MFKQLSIRVAILSVAVALPFVPAATATDLMPGQCAGLGTASCPGAVENFAFFPAGIIADTGTQMVTGMNASNTITWKADFEEFVLVDSATSNLDFVYQIQVVDGPGAVGRLTTTDYTGFTTNVGYCSNCPQLLQTGNPRVAPDYVTNNNGVIAFNFDVPQDKLGSGDETYDFVVKTNANYFASASSSLIDGATANVSSYGPTATPEPGSLMLLGSGLLGLGVVARKRFAKQ